MLNEKYLSEEEQFKKILNNDEIGRIKDIELREIRAKHWKIRHKYFLDELNIPDSKLEDAFRVDLNVERLELEEYKKRKGIL